MIKKFLAVFFAIFYLAITFGFVVNMHFCNGKLENLSIAYLATDNYSDLKACHVESYSCCSHDISSCKMDHDSSCCDNKQQLIHFDNNQILLSSVDIDLYPSVIEKFIQRFFIEFNSESQNTTTTFSREDYSSYPPPYILYKQMIIYA